MRLACVVHRFGREIAGGSEGHCRAIAERLAARHDVTILTTTAKDHVTWRNAYPAGASEEGPLHVLRFPVARPRALRAFADLSEVVFSASAPPEVQDEWFRANGPEAPELLAHLQAHGREYDLILFWSFRYYQSYFGVPLVAERAVLLPTAEEDPAIHIERLRHYFSLPAGLVYLTPEEQALVEPRIQGRIPPSCIIGSGLDEPPPVHPGALASAGVAAPYVLYLGRVDPNKGCDTLLRFYPRWLRETGAGVPLVLAGPANMPIPAHPSIRPLGFVAPAVREALLAGATLLVMPSPFESLSMVLLEAWNHGVPALVNAQCRVLKGQALRSGGALYYRSYDEFAAALTRLVDHPDVARTLGRAGREYVTRTYRWPTVMGTLESFLESLVAAQGSQG
ncbi:MAG: glycosyltransferase family 4 protein [Vicinamibacterales bacterium]